ncbi:MAG: hypothetical protein LBI74_01760 [Synergistaceae bacterium]|jgi:hypothetical protein|nr:hypothetical protein [Synergistaceae bacterium]
MSKETLKQVMRFVALRMLGVNEKQAQELNKAADEAPLRILEGDRRQMLVELPQPGFFEMGLQFLFTEDHLKNMLKYLTKEKRREGLYVEDGEGLSLEEKFNLLLQSCIQDDKSQYSLAMKTIMELRRIAREGNPDTQIMKIHPEDWMEKNLDFKGIILHGDGKTSYIKKMGKLTIDGIEFKYDYARSRNEKYETIKSKDILKYYMYKVCEIIGWFNFLHAMKTDKQVWNGQNLHVYGFSYTSRDDESKATFEISVDEGRYVSHLGTNFGILQDPQKWIDCFSSSEKRKTFLNDLTELYGEKKDCLKYDFDISSIEESLSFIKGWNSESYKINDDELVEYMRSNIDNEIQNKKDLQNSFMANLLSVNITYLTKDRKYILIQERGDSSGHLSDVGYQTSAAGFVAKDKMSKDGPSDKVNPGLVKINSFKVVDGALKAETLEETGLDDKKIIEYNIIGLVRDTSNYEVGLMGFGLIDAKVKNEEDVYNVIRPALEFGSAEVKGFVVIPFTLKDVIRFFLHEGSIRINADKKLVYSPWSNFMPLGAASVIFALVHEFSWDELIKAWDEERWWYMYMSINGRCGVPAVSFPAKWRKFYDDQRASFYSEEECDNRANNILKHFKAISTGGKN